MDLSLDLTLITWIWYVLEQITLAFTWNWQYLVLCEQLLNRRFTKSWVLNHSNKNSGTGNFVTILRFRNDDLLLTCLILFHLLIEFISQEMCRTFLNTWPSVKSFKIPFILQQYLNGIIIKDDWSCEWWD